MTFDFEHIVRVLAPPAAPKRNLFEREEVSKRLLTPLPEDYFLFVERYCEGTINEFIRILLPASENQYFDLGAQCRELGSVLSEVRAQNPEVPYVGYPAPGGLIPWARSQNGDVFFWKSGDPDPKRWPVVLCDGGMWDWETHPGPMTACLTDLLKGKVGRTILPGDFPPPRPIFVPDGP